MPDFGSVPAKLRERRQWVCWRYENRGGKRTKVPVGPDTGRNASSTDPSTWSTFEAAVARAEMGDLEGVGFMFSADDPYVGVDLDGVLDTETGEAELWALEVVEQLGSYCEVSPSGTGLHVFVEGEVPKGGPKTLRTDTLSKSTTELDSSRSQDDDSTVRQRASRIAERC